MNLGLNVNYINYQISFLKNIDENMRNKRKIQENQGSVPTRLFIYWLSIALE